MNVSHRMFDVYVPLHGFHWDGNDLEFVPGLHIKRLTTTPDLTRFENGLTPREFGNLRNEVSHWLTFETSEGIKPSPGVVSNLFLLSLWLTKSTKTHVAFRFKIGKEAAESETGVVRLLDRFQYVEGSTHTKFDDHDLRKAGSYFQAMLKIPPDTRLFMGQILTLNVCWQLHWHAAILFSATATETLLTYSESPGLTKRLSVAYACLLHTTQQDRDVAFSDFRECYKTRSDIVHGRTLNIAKSDRLERVVRWQNILRTLWAHILTNPILIGVLNGDDMQREAYIAPLVSGYVPPP